MLDMCYICTRKKDKYIVVRANIIKGSELRSSIIFQFSARWTNYADFYYQWSVFNFWPQNLYVTYKSSQRFWLFTLIYQYLPELFILRTQMLIECTLYGIMMHSNLTLTTVDVTGSGIMRSALTIILYLVLTKIWNDQFSLTWITSEICCHLIFHVFICYFVLHLLVFLVFCLVKFKSSL